MSYCQSIDVISSKTINIWEISTVSIYFLWVGELLVPLLAERLLALPSPVILQTLNRVVNVYFHEYEIQRLKGGFSRIEIFTHNQTSMGELIQIRMTFAYLTKLEFEIWTPNAKNSKDKYQPPILKRSLNILCRKVFLHCCQNSLRWLYPINNENQLSLKLDNFSIPTRHLFHFCSFNKHSFCGITTDNSDNYRKKSTWHKSS